MENRSEFFDRERQVITGLHDRSDHENPLSHRVASKHNVHNVSSDLAGPELTKTNSEGVHSVLQPELPEPNPRSDNDHFRIADETTKTTTALGSVEEKNAGLLRMQRQASNRTKGQD